MITSGLGCADGRALPPRGRNHIPRAQPACARGANPPMGAGHNDSVDQRRRSKGPGLFSELISSPLAALGRGFRDFLGELLCGALACLILLGILWGLRNHPGLTGMLLAAAAVSIGAGALVLLRERRDPSHTRRPLWASLAVACTLSFAVWWYYVASGCWVCGG